jgi:RNA polymerase sigma factor (sigma-70 family)
LVKGDVDDADDLVQDTFLKACKYKDKFNGENLRAWLFTILKNSFINNYRQDKNFPKDSVEVLFKELDESQTIESKLRCESIRKLIEEEKDEFKIPFKMFLEGYQYNEIAEKLDLKIGTVKSRIFFIRQHLMDKLKHIES